VGKGLVCNGSKVVEKLKREKYLTRKYTFSLKKRQGQAYRFRNTISEKEVKF